jgi:hypothetical protein
MKWNKKLSQQNKSGSGARTIRKYVYHEQLQFSKKVAEHRETVSCLPSEENSVETDDDVTQIQGLSSQRGNNNPEPRRSDIPTVVSKRKRKVDEVELRMLKLLESEQQEPNLHLSFFKGILPSIQHFDEDQTIEFHLGVLNVIKTLKTLYTFNPHIAPPSSLSNSQQYRHSQQIHPSPSATSYQNPTRDQCPTYYEGNLQPIPTIKPSQQVYPSSSSSVHQKPTCDQRSSTPLNITSPSSFSVHSALSDDLTDFI